MAHKKFTCRTRNGDKHLYIELFDNDGLRNDFVDWNNNKRRPAYVHYWNDVVCNEQYFTNGYFTDDNDTPNNISYYKNGNIKCLSKEGKCVNKKLIQSINYILFDISGNIIRQQYYDDSVDAFEV